MQADAQGVIASSVDPSVLLYVGRYACVAQWLYAASLPPPREDNNKWNSWYLSRLIARPEWTLLLCVNETTQLPNGFFLPAFALVARSRASQTCGGDGYRREAMLVIRGTKSTNDWSINAKVVQYTQF